MTTATHKPIEPVLQKMTSGQAVKIVCVGDSITAGTLDTGGVATLPWPARLQALLRQYYDNTLITVVNKGVAGSTVQGGLNRFTTDVTDEAPDLVMFNFGTNDANTAVDLDTYKTKVDAYLNKLLNYPVVVWGLTPRFKAHDSGAGEDTIHFYRNILRAASHKRGIPYVDTFGRLHRLYRQRALAAGTISSDGSHYNAEGYVLLGDMIFADAFANDDIFIAPGQFKDARGQWLVSDGALSSWGGNDLQDANSIVVSANTIRTYLYLDDAEPCDLALHVVADCTTTGQTVTVNNQSLSTGSSAAVDTSPDLAGATGYYCNDYAIVSVPLQPGLNNIQLSTATSVRINGFSAVRRKAKQYLPSFPEGHATDRGTEFWGSTRYEASVDAFEALRQGVLTVSPNASGLIEPYFLHQPDALSRQSTRYRFRGTISPGAALYLGQQTNDDVAYAYVWKFDFDGTNCVASARDHAGVIRTIETTALAIASGGADVQIDIRTGVTGTTVWVNATQVFSDNLPLGMGWALVSAGATGRSYWNPPMKKGVNASDTGAIRGEEWISFIDNSLHVIKDDGTEAVIGGGGSGPADTDALPEGATNLYFTSERVDDRVAALLVSGAGITLTYNDASGALTVDALPVVEMKTADHTLVLADAGKHLRMNATVANAVTIPPNSSVAFAIGTDVWVEQTGTGATTVVAGAGVTLRSTVGDHPSARYGVVHYRKIASDTWQVIART